MTKALIFDVDGTLADTEKDGHRVAFNMAFAEAGLDWDWDVALYGKLLAVTGGKERMAFYISDFLDTFSIPSDATETELSAYIANMHKRKTHFYLQLLKTGAIPLRPGVERVLNEARQAGLTLAIATTTTPDNVTWLLRSTLGEESIGWFDVIAAGDIVKDKKPAADIFLYAMDKLGLSAEQCIAFEDSENGFLSSNGANLKTIVTTNDYTRDHDFSGAALVLDQMGEADNPAEIISGTMSSSYLNLDAILSV